MNGKEFEEVFDSQVDISREILIEKAKEYADDTDRMHNFNAAAGLTGLTPVQTLGGFMLKHTVSIYDMINAGEPTSFSRDKWTEKITDHINYLILLQALLVEAFGDEKKGPAPWQHNQESESA